MVLFERLCLPQPELAVARVAAASAARGSIPDAGPSRGSPWNSCLWLLACIGGRRGAAALFAAQQWRVRRLGIVLPVRQQPAWSGVWRPISPCRPTSASASRMRSRPLVLAHEGVHRRRPRQRLEPARLRPAGPGSTGGTRQCGGPCAPSAPTRSWPAMPPCCWPQPGARASYAEALLIAHGLHPLVALWPGRWGGDAHPLVEGFPYFSTFKSSRAAVRCRRRPQPARPRRRRQRACRDESSAPAARVVLKLKGESSTRVGNAETKLSATPPPWSCRPAAGRCCLGSRRSSPAPTKCRSRSRQSRRPKAACC